MITTTWTKRSEQEPVQTVAPVIYGHWRDNEWIESSAQNVWGSGCNREYTHWRSIKVPPPPRELTQRERDQEYALNLARLSCRSAMDDILEAIYAERREVAKWLDAQFGVDWGRGTSATKATRQLRARLDEQGGGK